MRALGIPEGAFERSGAADGEEEPYAVWRCNADAVALFLACGTQWRVTVLAGEKGALMVWHGLDYAGAAAAAGGLGLELAGELFDDLRVMEAAALEILNGG